MHSKGGKPDAVLRIRQSGNHSGGRRAALLSLMKEHLHTPKRVVNIKNIKELEGIQKTDAGIRIGALVTMDELAKNADVKAAAKSLSDAAAAIPSPQIRH